MSDYIAAYIMIVYPRPVSHRHYDDVTQQRYRVGIVVWCTVLDAGDAYLITVSHRSATYRRHS